MNTKKIYTELLKRFDKDNMQEVSWCKGNMWTYLSFDGFVIYRIPTGLFPFNEKVVFSNARKYEENFFENIFPEEDETEPAKVTFMEYTEWRGKKIVVNKVENKKHHTWFNDKYKDNFDKDCEFRIGKKPTEPIHVYENELQVGVICPFRMKEEV